MSGVYIQDGEPRLTDCKISGHAKVGVVSDKGGGNVIRRKITTTRRSAFKPARACRCATAS